MSRSISRRMAIATGAFLLALTVCGVGWWYVRSRAMSDHNARASDAYRAGQWANSAEMARQALDIRKEDPTALRLLARASARLGRAGAAMAIYDRRLTPDELEAEDHLLLGLLHQRQGRPDATAREWKAALESARASPQTLEELGRLFIQSRMWDDAIAATERLSREPGFEARGSMMLGTIRVELNNVAGAAASFRRALELDPAEVDKSRGPKALRKLIARTFLREGRPTEARPLLRAILDRGPDAEASWLESRAFLQQGEKAPALASLKLAGSYRADNPLEPEPAVYVGEARCEKCHSKIFRDSLTSRHTRTYYRGEQLDRLPLPDRPLPDPDLAEVTHSFRRHDGSLHEETRVGTEVLDAVIDYAFGTDDRYLTTVSRDSGGGYHISRLSFYDTPEGKGWDRSSLDDIHADRAHPTEFQGKAIGVRDGLAKCLYCHVTNPRTGHELVGPETADRAIGCERCHGPAGNHIAALQAGLKDWAIVNPAGASPRTVTTKQCNDCHILENKVVNVDPENPGWIRSQGVGWLRSRCNIESNGTFGCVTCHNPHQGARATSAVEYESKCLGCHASSGQSAAKPPTGLLAPAPANPTYAPCPVNPSKDCLGCHMPRVRMDSLHMDLTDHHIRVRGDKSATK